MEIELAIAILVLLFLVLLSTVDMAFTQQSDVSLRRLATESDAERHERSASFLREIVEDRPKFRFALSSTLQVLLITFTVLLSLIVLRFTENHYYLVLFALGLGLLATVLFRQILPRLIVRRKPEAVLLFLLPLVRPLYRIVATVGEPFMPASAKEIQKLEMTAAPEMVDTRSDDAADDFQALIEVGEAEGIIEERERELIESMVEFSDTRAAEIMTPRTEICAVPVEATIRQARDLMIEEKYSRLPVYRDTIDNVEGVLYVRDLLNAWSRGQEESLVNEILRDAFFVPETITASELLKQMQSDHVQIAIVIDEYGGVAGLVTVEDLLEEIVGEIEDEDIEQEEIIEIIEGKDGYFDVLGSTEIDNIERLFHLELEDDDYTTIAGLVTSEAGHVPKVGEKLVLRGLDIEILKADEKKVWLVRLRKAEPPTDEESEEK